MERAKQVVGREEKEKVVFIKGTGQINRGDKSENSPLYNQKVQIKGKTQ